MAHKLCIMQRYANGWCTDKQILIITKLVMYESYTSR